MFKLLLGRAGTGKTTAVLKRLCRAGVERPQVLLVPEQQSHETERALCTVGGPQASLYAEVLSFSRLANRIFQTAGGLGEEELESGGRLLLMYRAVRGVSPALKVYGQPSKRPAFLNSLLVTVDELKSCRVSYETLIQAGEDCPGPEGDKLRDLGLIFGEYEALVARTALDPRDRLTRAADKLRDSHWAQGKDIWLDGFTDFTPQQRELLELLMAQSVSMTVALTCDHLEDNEGGTGIFSPARHTAQTLLRLARERGVACEVEHLVPGETGKAAALVWLEEALFGAFGCQPGVCEGAVELFQAATPRGEVEWTAGRILRMVREEGYRFRDIGVAARNYGAYRDIVETVFGRYGVPVFSSAMTDILEKPVLALVTAALDATAGGYRYDDVFRYLKTGLTGLLQEDTDLLENYVLKWDIRGSRWTQAKDWSWHPKGYGLKWTQEDRDLVERVNRTRRQVTGPMEALRKNPDRTGRGQAVALYTFLEEIGLPDRLEERMDQLARWGQLALAEEYRQLWDILCGALEQCARLLGEAAMELEEFALLFRLVLSQYDVGSIPVSLDRVTAGETTRQTGHRVKALFLLGADDASLPQVGTAPGLLSDGDRALLATYGLELGQSQRELLYREMTTIYQICARPSQKLAVTWPAQGTGGEERRPSFLVERLGLLFSDLKTVWEEDLNGSFRLEAPLPALEQAGRDKKARWALERLAVYADQVARLDRAAAWERGRLSRQTVDRLYGKRVAMSASRMDQYKSCHFSYFMRYGLAAEPRKPAGFTAPEYGTFVHYVLERVLRDEMFAQTVLPGVTEGDEARSRKLRRLTREAVDSYVAEELGGLEGQSPRFQYLFRRLLRTVQAVVDNVAEELLHSQFKPISFELGFGKDGDLPPVELTYGGVTVSVTGFVDRVDGWIDKERLNLRVVDYKTGRKTFDLTEVWNGLGLQMLLYLFTLEKRGQALYGLPVEGAGVLYLPAREAVIRAGRGISDEELRKKTDRELRRSGLVVNDRRVLDAMEPQGEGGYRFLPLKVSRSTGEITGEALASAEQLGKLGKHVQRVLEDICKELASGSIAADPFWRGPEKNACRFCDYGAACHFEPGRNGDCRRWLTGMDAQVFWEQIEREREGSEWN